MIAEKELIDKCKKGDKKSQYLLVKRYSGKLMGICRRYTRDDNMAKDVLQETFIRIFTNISSFKGTGSFEGWMCKIAVRSSLQWIQKVYFKKEQQVEFIKNDARMEPEVYSYLGMEVILKYIEQLPVEYRTVFNLAVLEGYSHKEIATLLKINENTSRSYLLRARRQLQSQLNGPQKKEIA